MIFVTSFQKTYVEHFYYAFLSLGILTAKILIHFYFIKKKGKNKLNTKKLNKKIVFHIKIE